ncbi:NnrS family protein [Amantichitinum ursilacus]|uniref:NnrS protein n=1 Tax=Amantichitinum ursilacus TaxID=857265 RepID=A0A0N0GM29_9NEIS|nr:NnrS family protein [Amantichitinum ursilacus]KPC50676.1 NnrS protein [Amantichitinum ursilacus]
MCTLRAAPHRVGFFMGSVAMLASFAWWALLMVQRAQGVAPLSAIPPAWLHADLMLFGFLPLFMLGFINTAGPKWLGVDPPARPHWLGSTVLYGAGSLLVVGASRWPVLQALGDVLHVAGWAWAIAIWAGRIRRSASPDQRHARSVLLAFGLGGLALALQVAVSTHAVSARWASVVVSLGLWGFLLPVFLTVSHRMIPFFSSVVLQPYQPWRPFWLLYAWIGLSLTHGALAIAAGFTPYACSALPDLVWAGLLLYTSWRWQLRRSFKAPLLGMLHASFAWAGIAMLLFALQSAAAAAGVYIGGYAPLHALTLGYFCSMLLAFVTRVSLGHSGRPLMIGRLTACLYWLVHAVALARVSAEFVPAHASALFSIAAVTALGTLAVWAVRYVPMYVLPRPDGQAG